MIYDGLRVVDCSRDIAGAYCTKLLADLGADVVAVHELPAERRELFTYLRTSQRLVPVEEAPDWVRDADLVVGGLDVAEGPLVRVAISAFGAGGPDSGTDLPEPVLQARSGSLSAHGHMGKPPLPLGGELGEYVTGAFAALGAVTAWWRASRTGVPELVDVSKLEAMQLTMVTTPTLMANFPGGRAGTFRWVMIPGNEPCKNGEFIGITTVTTQQWLSLLRVIGREDLLDDKKLTTMIGRFVRAAEVNKLLRDYTEAHTAAEVVEACARERVPAAIVGNGAVLPEFDQLVERDVFLQQPDEDWIRPRRPFRFSKVADRPLEAPKPASHADGDAWAGNWPREPGEVGERPFTGITMIDFTAFWSGPCATAWFASMGADVIKVESMQRPDGIRLSATVRPDQNPRFYELSPLFHAANLGKRGITLDLTQPEGLEIVRRLIASADIVAENFTPRVMDSFGLSYEQVSALNPSVVMLRLPAFGLTGPWRDRPGFAQTMEQLTGMAWMTGYEGGPPIIPGGFVDPFVGAHAATAIVAALEHRARTGEGQLVEMPMIEVAAAATAEQVIEYSAHGTLAGRRGTPGVYACAGDEQWIALDDSVDPLGAEERAAWCAERPPEAAVEELMAEGIAAAAMVPASEALDDRQHVARAFFQTIEHPDAGVQQYPGWPARLSGGPAKPWTGPAPQLGQHTVAVLRERLELTEAELDRLRDAAVTGTHLAMG
ncbi:MAG TPA: CoA transferase [Acidimicrobiia bacterium]